MTTQNPKIKRLTCPKCASDLLVLFRGEPHGLSKAELTKALRQIKTNQIYGFRCLCCDHIERFKKPIRRLKKCQN